MTLVESLEETKVDGPAKIRRRITTIPDAFLRLHDFDLGGIGRNDLSI